MDLYNRLEKGIRKGQKCPQERIREGIRERIREGPEDPENKIFLQLYFVILLDNSMDKPSNYFLKIIVVYLHCGSSLGGRFSGGSGG